VAGESLGWEGVTEPIAFNVTIQPCRRVRRSETARPPRIKIEVTIKAWLSAPLVLSGVADFGVMALSGIAPTFSLFPSSNFSAACCATAWLAMASVTRRMAACISGSEGLSSNPLM
jgi:hypothetical protein